MLVGVVQMCSGEDREGNLAKAERFISIAAQQGCKLVVLPEHFSFRGKDTQLRAYAESIPDGPVSQWARNLAQKLKIWLLAGTIPERDGEKIYNTSMLINPEGHIIARYRKIHLFDAVIHGAVYKESAVFSPGHTPCAVETPLGKLGLSICFDIRFPELYVTLTRMGAEILLVPASFALYTGKDHWEPLLRARAIENQAYVVASNQVGESPEKKLSLGRSAIIDPWGVAIAQASDIETVIWGEVDVQYLRNIRSTYPFMQARNRTI
jgi:predicted amidohydrolase